MVTPLFSINFQQLAEQPRFAGLAGRLAALPPISSPDTFNRFCRDACRLWREEFPQNIGAITHEFSRQLKEVELGGGGVVRTGWGGMVITTRAEPRIERFLVLRRGGYFALEMHEVKEENLEIREGAGLFLWRRDPAEEGLTAEVLTPGARYHLAPGIEHCLIGAENLLVYERSIEPRGMDHDVIVVYEPGPAR